MEHCLLEHKVAILQGLYRQLQEIRVFLYWETFCSGISRSPTSEVLVQQLVFRDEGPLNASDRSG